MVPVSLRTALEQSLNIPAVKLANQVGVEKPLFLRPATGNYNAGISGATNDRNLAMALGGLTRGVIPLELASAYGVLS